MIQVKGCHRTIKILGFLPLFLLCSLGGFVEADTGEIDYKANFTAYGM